MKQTTHKNKKFLGIILTTIFAITMFAGFSQISFADTASAPQTPAPTAPTAPATKPNTANEEEQYNLKDLKFNVNDQLKLPNASGTAQQPKTYFSDTQNPPLIAFILSVINYATGIIGTIAMIIFIIAGFMLVIAQGDQTKIDKAKEIIKYAVIGLLITFMSYVITIFVQSLFITTTPAPATPPATTQPK